MGSALSQKGPPDGKVKDLKIKQNYVAMVKLTIQMHFQQFDDFKFLIFCRESRVSNCSGLGGMVPILVENPESRLDFIRDTSIPIL